MPKAPKYTTDRAALFDLMDTIYGNPEIREAFKAIAAADLVLEGACDRTETSCKGVRVTQLRSEGVSI